LERIEEALDRIREVYGIKGGNLSIFSNKLTERIIDGVNMRS
jgi:hypothetical protein